MDNKSTFNQFITERSINKIQKEFSEVVTKMSELAKQYSASEGDEKQSILSELKELTARKKELTAELDAKVAGTDKDIALAISESEEVDLYINEGRKITVKRRYTENHPEVTVGKAAKIRNKVLEAIKDGTITQEEFNSIVSELSNDSKRWLKRNNKYFTISEEGISLSKFGSRILNSITVNEKTEENPEIWVPNQFDKAVNKLKGNKLNYAEVAKLARKYEVDLDNAIKYVEFGWDIDLQEQKNTNMKTQFIYESFGSFVESLNEKFSSMKLQSILTNASSMPTDFAKTFYQMAKIQLDKVQDIDIIEMDPASARKEKRNNAVYLYFTDNEKENPYAGKNSWGVTTIPGNTLLAVTDGSNEWLAAEYSSRWSSNRTKSLSKAKRDDSAGFGKSSANDSWGSGISSLTKAAELADRAYVLDLDILRARYSTVGQRDERSAAKAGAIAFKDDKEFKSENLKRYNEILANRAATLPLDAEVEKAIDTISEQIKKALAGGEKTQYGEIIVGTSKKGRIAKLTDSANHMRNILDDFQRYVQSTNQAEIEKAAGYGGDYYQNDIKRRAKDLNDRLKQVDDFGYAW